MPTHLDRVPALDRPDLLAAPVAAALAALPAETAALVTVAEIDPTLADTEAFCAEYGVLLEESANCVVIAARRGEDTTYAACMVLATTKADVNSTARKRLGARKASFAPMDDAVSLTGMEYGGITPVGLPEGWPVLVDAAAAAAPVAVVGSGVRRSKLWLPGRVLAELAGAEVVEGLGVPR
jgi:prolyl-tRNA editing enzyme YbaK/EbsC (Cys-tRNA(Pro) deacylase)